jgi:hypothetical protein
VRSRAGAIWLASLAIAGLLLVFVLPGYLQSAPQAYPVSDGAVIELYTLHAIRNFWHTGPYSQFGWHHPGPLLFYLLAPFYALSHLRTFGLQVGAFAINLASLLTIVLLLLRRATPGVASIGIVGVGIYVFRLTPLAASYWNPHIVAFPVGALLVLCARLASGRLNTLPAVVFVGSFLAQTHVSLVPYVAGISGVAFIAAILWREPGADYHERDSRRRSVGWWINASAWLALVQWLLPIAQELSHSPGNLSNLMKFFGEPYTHHPLDLIAHVWGDVMTSVVRPGLAVPVGVPLSVHDLQRQGITLIVLAIGQIAWLVVCCRAAARRGHRFDAALCGLGALASLIAFWSIANIRALIGDYMVFWMSIVALLNWTAAAGVTADALLARRLRIAVALRCAAVAAALVVAAGFARTGVTQLEGVRLGKRLPAPDRDILAVGTQIEAYLTREHLKRPMFQIMPGAWADGAGIFLQRARLGLPVAVTADLVDFYGAPFAPTGNEDVTLSIANPPAHEDLQKRTGDRLIARSGPIFIHTIAPAAPTATQPPPNR